MYGTHKIINDRLIGGFGFSFIGVRPCYDGEFRIVNSQYRSEVVNGEYLGIVEGSIELCIDGYRGPVCDIGWDDSAANVFCRQYQSPDYGKQQ